MENYTDDPGGLDDLRDLLRLREASDAPKDGRIPREIQLSIDNLTPNGSKIREVVTQEALRAYGVRPIEVDTRKRLPFNEVVAKDSWFGRYLEYCSDSMPPPQLLFGAALAYITAGLGGFPVIRWPVIAQGLRPRMYVMLIGGTGAGKGTSVNLADDVIMPALAPHLLGFDGTMPGFIRGLQKRFQEKGGVLGEGDTVSDGMVVAEEAHMLFGGERHKEDLISSLCQMFTHHTRDWKKLLKTEGDIVIQNPFLTILAASNMPFMRMLPGAMTGTGFLPRFSMFDCAPWEEKKPTGWVEYAEGKSGKAQLQADLELALKKCPTEMLLLDEAKAWIMDYTQCRVAQQGAAETDDQVGYWLSRKPEYVLKLGTLFQVLDSPGDNVLKAVHLDRAAAIADWQDTCVKRVYHEVGVSREGQIQHEVLAQIRKMGGSALAKDVKRKMRHSYKVPMIVEAMDSLEQCGEGRVHRARGGEPERWEVF